MDCSFFSLLLKGPLALLVPLQAQDSSRHAEFSGTVIRNELRGNDLSRVSPVVRTLADTASHLGICDSSGQIAIQVALEEALVNAIIHGNLEVPSTLKDEAGDEAFYRLLKQRQYESPFADRVVYVDAEFRSDEVRFRVADEGPGFDLNALADPGLPENVCRSHGRGVAMMRSFMDRVEFNPRGNVVVLTKRRSVAAPEAA